MRSDNCILLQAHGRIYTQYTFISTFSLRDAGFKDEILIYCDPENIDDMRSFNKKMNLDLNIKPFEIKNYTRTYGPAYRFLYDVDYWSGKNVYIGDTDTYYCMNQNIFECHNKHANTIGMPISCMMREIQGLNNRSLRMIISNIRHSGLKDTIRLALKSGLINQYRTTMGYIYLKSELTSSDEFVSIAKKYFKILESKPKFNHHVRLFYDETFFYDLLKELNIYPPIIHKGMMEDLSYDLEYKPNSIYYRPMWGIHLNSTRPRKYWGPGGKPVPKLLKYENYKRYVKKFVKDMNSEKTSMLKTFFDEDFGKYILNLSKEFQGII